MTAYNGKSHAWADCLTCGDEAIREGVDDRPDPMQAWARRHIAKNPRHEVHVVTERTRVYKGARP